MKPNDRPVAVVRTDSVEGRGGDRLTDSTAA